jgi:hypothetical protein
MSKRMLATLMMVCLVGAFCIKVSAQGADPAGEKSPAKSKKPAKPTQTQTALTTTGMMGEVTALDKTAGTFTVKDASGTEKSFTGARAKIKSLKLAGKVKVTYTTDSQGTTRVTGVVAYMEKTARATSKAMKKGTAETK